MATGVAVRAATFGQCIDAVRALEVTWRPGTVDGLSDDDVQAELAAAELPVLVPDLSALEALGVPLHTVEHTYCPLEPNPAIAAALGLPQGNVTCHVVQVVSAAMGKPVKLLWHRTDDFRHGRVHPACRSTIRAVHTDDAIVAFGQSHTSVNTDFGHGLGEVPATGPPVAPLVTAAAAGAAIAMRRSAKMPP